MKKSEELQPRTRAYATAKAKHNILCMQAVAPHPPPQRTLHPSRLPSAPIQRFNLLRPSWFDQSSNEQGHKRPSVFPDHDVDEMEAELYARNQVQAIRTSLKNQEIVREYISKVLKNNL